MTTTTLNLSPEHVANLERENAQLRDCLKWARNEAHRAQLMLNKLQALASDAHAFYLDIHRGDDPKGGA